MKKNRFVPLSTIVALISFCCGGVSCCLRRCIAFGQANILAMLPHRRSRIFCRVIPLPRIQCSFTGLCLRVMWGMLLVICPVTVHAGVIHFSAADCLEKIGRTVSKALPGTEIHLAPGIYSGILRISNAKGISKNPVILAGSPGTLIDARNPGRLDRDGYGEHGILIQNSAHVMLKKIEIQGAERGITIGNCMNVSVLDCQIHDVRNYGIMNYRSSGSRIAGNHIARSLKEHGIYISGEAHALCIQDNVIEETHINGIHCNGKISSCLIERNRLYRIGHYPTKEGGAAVTLINGASDALVRNNMFVDIYGQGLTLNGPGIQVINNVFHDVDWSVILGLPGAANIEFFNNIVIEKKAVPFQIHGSVLASLQSDYNYYCMKNQKLYENQEKRLNWKQWQKKGFDINSIRGKMPFPGYVRSSKEQGIMTDDYRLNKDSYAVDGGLPSMEDAEIPPGLEGKRADMGAFGGPGNGWLEE